MSCNVATETEVKRRKEYYLKVKEMRSKSKVSEIVKPKYLAIISKLKKKRSIDKRTNADFSREINANIVTIRNILNGKGTKINLLIKISNALGFNVYMDDLVVKSVNQVIYCIINNQLDLDISFIDISIKSGMSVSTVEHMINGEHVPTVINIMKMCEVLGIKFDIKPIKYN